MNFVNKALVSLALLSTLGTAAAVPLTDFVDADPDRTITTGSPWTFTHDITDGLDGYIAGLDTIASALLSIHLVDFVNKKNEEFSFLIGSSGVSQVFNYSNLNNGSGGDNYNIALVAALSDLNADGKLDITLSAQTGSYEFADSILTAEIVRGTSVTAPANVSLADPLPEPASLVLLGIGLFSLGAVRRRRR